MLLETHVPLRYILTKIHRDVLTALAVAALVDLILEINRAFLPPLPATIPAFMGTSISLILSFRLNQSYERWWEARKIWGAIVNDSRSLVRQLLSFAGDDSETACRIGRRQVGWCYCLGQSLRRLDWRTGTLEHLNDEDIAEVERHTNKSVALLQLHARDLGTLATVGRLSDYQRVAIDDTLNRLTDSMGQAERIKQTVFPRTYRMFLHAFIYLFIATLSIVLYETQGPWQILLTTLISTPFFLLEKTAVHMQDPFENRPTDTSVTAIARTIEINLRELLGDEEIPEPLAPGDFYIM